MLEVPEKLMTATETLEAILRDHRAEFVDRYLYPEIAADEWATRLLLYPITKHGEIRKHPTFSLGFAPVSYDLCVQRDGSVAPDNLRDSPRPWRVGLGKGKRARAYSSKTKAIKEFIDAVRASSPLHP